MDLQTVFVRHFIKAFTHRIRQLRHVTDVADDPVDPAYGPDGPYGSDGPYGPDDSEFPERSAAQDSQDAPMEVAEQAATDGDRASQES